MIIPSSYQNFSIFRGNPFLKEQSDTKTRPDIIVNRGYFYRQKPCENSGKPEPATSPVIPHFPHPPDFRGHNFGKMRNRAGIIQRFPTGTVEAGYSSVAVTKSRIGCGLGRGRHRPGDIPASCSFLQLL
jgi:hypothetical protein